MFTPTRGGLQFQAPNIPGLVRPAPDLGNTLDSVFNAYLANQQNQRTQQTFDRQNATQNFAETAQYGKPLQQFTQGQIQEAQGPAPLNTPEMIARPGMAGPTYSDPAVAQLHSAFEEMKAQRQAQLAAAGAGLAKTQAETSKLQGEGALANLQVGLLGGAPGAAGGGAGGSVPYPQGQGPLAGGPVQKNLVQQVADRVASKEMTPAQADEMLGRNPLAHLAFVKELANRGLDIQTLAREAKGKDALNSTLNSAAVQVPVAAGKALSHALDVLDELSKNVPRSQYQIINRVGLGAAAQMGGETGRIAQRLLNQAATASDLYQGAYGAGSDKKLELAAKVLDPKQTIDQLGDSIRLVQADTTNRNNSLLQNNAPTVHPKFDGPVQTRTLKDGTQVKVKQTADGSYVEVR